MTRDPLLVGLMALTFVTGLVDAVSILGLGRVFTANMTGNVVFLGFAAAGAPGLSVARTSAAVVAFLLGAVAGGRISLRLAAGSPEIGRASCRERVGVTVIAV